MCLLLTMEAPFDLIAAWFPQGSLQSLRRGDTDHPIVGRGTSHENRMGWTKAFCSKKRKHAQHVLDDSQSPSKKRKGGPHNGNTTCYGPWMARPEVDDLKYTKMLEYVFSQYRKLVHIQKTKQAVAAVAARVAASKAVAAAAFATITGHSVATFLSEIAPNDDRHATPMVTYNLNKGERDTSPLGMSITPNGSDISIDAIRFPTACIYVGDRIMTINGVPVEKIPPENVISCFKKRPLTLKIVGRADATKMLTVTKPGSLGISFSDSDSWDSFRIRIEKVKPNSFLKMQVNEGDFIVAINGTPVEEEVMTHEEIMRRFKARPLDLTLRRKKTIA